MATERMTLLARIEDAARSDRPDVLRETLAWALQRLMEDEVTERLGAEAHERTPERTGQRNGHRMRLLDTRVGALELGIPKLRSGSYFPDWLLEPRRRTERALVAVIQEAWVKGVSTRRVDDLVRAMGAPRASAAAPCPGCAPSWTPTSPRSATAGSTGSAIPMCGWTRRRSGCVRAAG